jgi:acyl-coenzyme A synthetase/AMP-(fatty) acid ligase
VQTSGTTGVSKKVLMSSANDAVQLPRRAETFGLNQDSVVSVFEATPSTGAGHKWPASTWLAGGTVIAEQGREPYQGLLHPGITHAVLTPASLAAILAAPAGAFPRRDAMHLVVTSGAMTRTQVDQAKARISPRLSSWLTSTEAGGIALTRLDTPEDQEWHRLVPGRVVEIVDESDRPVTAGEIGRVRVGTVGGPTGYLYDEAATRTFFRNGFFYPGDLAVIRSDGRLALQGRVTDIINVGGHKIPPAPIEDRLTELFGVNAICLFSMQNDSGEEEIHAVVETPARINSERLIAAIDQELRGSHGARVHYVAVLPQSVGQSLASGGSRSSHGRPAAISPDGPASLVSATALPCLLCCRFAPARARRQSNAHRKATWPLRFCNSKTSH